MCCEIRAADVKCVEKNDNTVKNLVYFHQQRSIWEHVTKMKYLAFDGGAGGQKRQTIF